MDNKLMKTYIRPDVIFTHGKGSYLYDENNNEYLDLVAGVAVNALGHSHPTVIEALVNQSSKLMHISNMYWTNEQLELAELLVKESNMEAVFFTNSGTESIETAIKIARKYGKKFDEKKSEIIYLENSFHGRSIGALSITGQMKYQTPFMPLMDETKMVKSNCTEALEEAISEKTCAVFIEPIQGEGGIIPLDKEYLAEIRMLCTKYNALLIFDEVQCGIGRTGNLFAFQTMGIESDVVCLAKGLGGGFPIGAVIVNNRSNILQPGDHGCTFGGNPLGCAVSLAVVKTVNSKIIFRLQF